MNTNNNVPIIHRPIHPKCYNIDISNYMHINNRKPLSIRELQKVSFSMLPLSQKIKIRDLGPPRPNFQLKREINVSATKTTEKSSTRKTSNQTLHASKIYKEYDWICGDENKRVFNCFPCLLFGGTTNKGSLNPTLGYGRLHARTEAHIRNALSLAMLGKGTVTINGSPNGIHKAHNETVKRNRQLLLRIVKGYIEHADLYEFVLNSENSLSTKVSPITFTDLLFKVDRTLKECYEYSPLFSAIMPKDLEEQVLIASLHLYQTMVLEEINAAKFVALITEETTDIAHKDQLMIVVRYLLDNGVVERFWSFVKPAERDAKSYAKSILYELDIILQDSKEKLISQSHIGGVIFSPLISDVHKLISEEYKNAIYVHYHAYKLTEVMERAVCQNGRVRDFFANLYGMYTFFQKHPQMLQAFYDAATLYSEGSFEKGALVFIYENKGEILNFMILLHTDLDSSPYFIREADVCEKLLVDDGFLYFLSFFYFLMADVNVFYESLQNSFVDSVKIGESINEFLDEIRKTKDAIAVENSDNDDKTSEAFLRAFAKIEICNVMLKEIQERFCFTNHWEAHILFKSEQYYKFHGNFPDHILNNATEYFKFNHREKLRVELQTLYTRTDLMVCRNAHDLLWAFHHYKLKRVFDKTTALLHVILTIPTMMVEAENKICAVKRVRRAASLAANERAATALTMLLSERETISSFRGFAERLVDVYVKQERRENEFTYC